MGLDMYFHKHVYLGNQFKSENPEIHGKPYKFEIEGVNTNRVSEIIEQVGYLRKANAIHGWLVDNLADGVDNCQEIYFPEDKIRELLHIINEVLLASKLIDGKIQNGSTFENGEEKPNIEDGKVIEDPSVAKELLPTTEGFFFGGYGYDKYYIEDLKETKKILEGMLKEEGDYYYRASW